MAGTTPVLSVRSFLSFFLLRRQLIRVTESCDLLVKIHGIIIWRRLWGRDYLARLIASRTQELHGTHPLNGYYQQRSRRRAAAIHSIGETGLNPNGHGGTSHKTEP